MLTEDPTVTYEVKQSVVSNNICKDEVEYVCNVANDGEMILWVQWTVDDKEIPGETISSNDLPTFLTSTQVTDVGIQNYPFTVSSHCYMLI